MRGFLDLFRAGRDRRPKAKSTRMVPAAEGLESRNLMARTGAILANWTGIFADAVGLAAPISGLGTSTVQFGTPVAGGTGQTRLSYTGQSFPVPIRVLRHRANDGVQVGFLTFTNTPLSAPPLAGLNMAVTISSDVGQRTVRVPLAVDTTPNFFGDVPDVIRLVGRPTVRLLRGFSVQIVGFGIPNPAGGRVFLTNQVAVDEGATASFVLVGRLIRR